MENQTTQWYNVTHLGNTTIRDNAWLVLSGSLHNEGEIVLNSNGGDTQLRTINGNLQLTGGGTIRLSAPTARIGGTGSTLVNTDNTITGTGNIGNNAISIVNQSLIEAGNGDSLTIDPVNAGGGVAAFTNQGIVRATGGGNITLTGSNFGEFHGSGVYEAEADSSLNLISSAIVRGGTFSTSGSGEIHIMENHTVQWYDVTSLGNTIIRDNARLELSGSLHNEGEIVLQGNGGATQLYVGSALPLTGGGTIRLTGTTARIGGNGSMLVNTDNTITGSGNIGYNSARITNHGLIEASNGDAVVVDPVNGGSGIITFNNAGSGVVRATSGGSVTLTGSNFGEFGGNGTFEALDNGNINFDSSAIVQNLAGGVLNSGTWRAIDSGNGANIRIQNNSASLINSIGADAAVVLSGANSNFTVRAANTSIDSTLVDVAGQLTLQEGRVMNLTNGLTHSGSLLIDGAASKLAVTGNFTQSAGNTTLVGGGTLELVGASNEVSGGTFSGNGTIAGNIVNAAGQFSPGLSAGELTITGNFTQRLPGSLSIEIGGTNQGVDFDHLLIGGLAELDGSLLVSLIDGFTPEATDTFTILTSQSLTGLFANATSTIALQGNLGFFDVTYTGTSVVLGNYSAIPEPSALIVLSLMGGIGISRRRRNR